MTACTSFFRSKEFFRSFVLWNKTTGYCENKTKTKGTKSISLKLVYAYLQNVGFQVLNPTWNKRTTWTFRCQQYEPKESSLSVENMTSICGVYCLIMTSQRGCNGWLGKFKIDERKRVSLGVLSNCRSGAPLSGGRRATCFPETGERSRQLRSVDHNNSILTRHH